ncbi:MAG: ComEA family DNA-binding protein [Candidatus Limnocylindrales bacterium]
MDASAPWRAIETPENARPEPPPERLSPGGHGLLLAAAGALMAVSVGAALLVASQQGGQVQVVSGSSESAGEPIEPDASRATLVIEVAGAVAHPGVYSLPVGSRVADAIQAAGGYSPDVDPRQTETQLNLAAKLVDAELIRVPRRGDGSASSSTAGGAKASVGLLNLNTATAEQLDTLPGIGPATAQKIIASREQQPFQKVDDLVTRKIVASSTLAKFRSLVTVG